MALRDKVKSVGVAVKKKIREDNERGARQSLIEELFYDFNRSRTQVYGFNFVRGLFFGAGSVIGGTVIIGLLVWLLSGLGSVIPPLGDFFDGITSTIERGPDTEQ